MSNLDIIRELGRVKAEFQLRSLATIMGFQCDSGSDPQGENSRSGVECEASQSGLQGIAQTPIGDHP